MFRAFVRSLTKAHQEHFFSDGRFSIGTAESVFYASTINAWNSKDISMLVKVEPKQIQAVSAQIRKYLLEGSARSENVKGRLTDACEIIK